jgi:hydroxymethylglutaryl-CoA lyase
LLSLIPKQLDFSQAHTTNSVGKKHNQCWTRGLVTNTLSRMVKQQPLLISECGPRDGLQALRRIMPTATKLAWIEALYLAGLREIEVTSFVPETLLPQMRDAADVVRFAATLPGLNVLALVPNKHGAEAAIAAGAHAISIPVSASEGHSLANVRKSRAQMLDVVRDIVAVRNATAPGVKIEANISVAFGCAIDGLVPEDDVVRLSSQLVHAGADVTGLSDTSGMGNPAQVKRLFARLIGEIGVHCGAAHFHNTRGLGLANCLAAFEAGVRTFDSSLAGLGGCPNSPGASGNVVTEDLVYMFEAMGEQTGVSLEKLLLCREILSAALPGEPLHGHVAESGFAIGLAA